MEQTKVEGMHPVYTGNLCGCMLFLIMAIIYICSELLPLDHTKCLQHFLFREFSSYLGTMVVPCFPTVYTGLFTPAKDMIA